MIDLKDNPPFLNEFLEYLCNLYGQSFIDIEPVAQASLNQTRVHLPEKGACSVADLILMKMNERKIGKSQPPARVTPCFIEEEQNDKSGAEQMIEFIQSSKRGVLLKTHKSGHESLQDE